MDTRCTRAACLVRHNKNYALAADKLYKLGFSTGVLMKCAFTEEGKEIIHEIHEGSYGNHAT